MSTAVRKQRETGNICFSVSASLNNGEETHPLFCGVFASVEALMLFILEESAGSANFDMRTITGKNEKATEILVAMDKNQFLLSEELIRVELKEMIQPNLEDGIIAASLLAPLFIDLRLEFHFPESQATKQICITKRALIL